MRKIILIMLLILISTGTCFADSQLDKWQYSKDISTVGANKYKSVFLDGDVYRNSKGDLSDIRIVDDNGDFVAYYLQNNNTYEHQKDLIYQTEKIRTFIEKKNKIIDFKVIPLIQNADILVNNLDFKILSQNYVKNIDIYGSFDGVAWNFFNTDTIYNVDNLSKDIIKFSEVKRYKYYRIKIPNNLENIDIDNLQARNSNIEIGQEDFLKKVDLKYDIYTKDKSTYIEVHNPNKLKLSQLKLNIDGIFNRHFEVATKETQDKPGVFCTQGDIYNLKFNDLNVSSTTINFESFNINNNLIQIKIMNKDDKPLDIKGFEATHYVDKLVFEGLNKAQYKLYFGNPEANKQSYDLELYKAHIEKEKQDPCTLQIKTNTNFIPAATPKAKDYKPIFNLVIIFVTGILIFLVLRKLKVKK